MILMEMDRSDVLYLRICEVNNERGWVDRVMCLILEV